MADPFSTALDDIYSTELAVPATMDGVAITVIDKTRRKTQASSGIEVRGVEPAATARVLELTNKGIAQEDYRGAVLTFNGRSWTVRHYDLIGSPRGEDFGEVYFYLMEIESTDG